MKQVQERYTSRTDCLAPLSIRRGAVASLADAVRQNRNQVTGGIAMSDRTSIVVSPTDLSTGGTDVSCATQVLRTDLLMKKCD